MTARKFVVSKRGVKREARSPRLTARERLLEHKEGCMTRSIVQVATAGHVENGATQAEFSVFALADDGTLWVASNRNLFGDCDHVWSLVTNVPPGVPR